MTTTTKLKDREPVRLYVYGLVGPLAALLVALGLVDGSAAVAIVGLAAAALAIPATEAARSRVTPDAKRRL